MGTRRVLAALLTAAVALSLTAAPDRLRRRACRFPRRPQRGRRSGRDGAGPGGAGHSGHEHPAGEHILRRRGSMHPDLSMHHSSVTIAGRPEAQEAVNEALLALEEAFTQGGENGGGLEEYKAAAQAEYEFRQQQGGNEYPWSYALEQTVLVGRGGQPGTVFYLRPVFQYGRNPWQHAPPGLYL